MQASEEQPKIMSRQLVIKFGLLLHGPHAEMSRAEMQGTMGAPKNVFQKISKTFTATCQKFEVGNVREEKVSSWRTPNQTLYTARRSGASESSSEILQLPHDRQSLTTHCRSFEAEVVQIHRM